LFKKVIALLKDEKGSLDQMVWVVGGAMIVAVIVVLALGYAPQTVQTLWNSATQTIMGKLGF
jgi:uncharacterized membrane-anchored protein